MLSSIVIFETLSSALPTIVRLAYLVGNGMHDLSLIEARDPL